MGVFDIFGSKHGFDPNKFEKEFSQLTTDINKTKQQLTRLTQRKQRLNEKLETFVSLGYVLILLYCYLSIPNNVHATNRIQQFIKGQTKYNIYVLIGWPLSSILIIKAVSFVFNYLVHRQDRYLAKLQTKHKAKMDELKKITNFNATNELINKYGEKQLPQQTPQLQQVQQRLNKKSSKKQDELRAQALKELHLNDKQLSLSQKTGTSKKQNDDDDDDAKQQPTQAPQPNTRTFQDRLLDLFVGSDNSESVEQRYALICSHCFAHNGLAPPHCEDPLLVKYQCWKCGAMNGKGMLFGHAEEQQKLEEAVKLEKSTDKLEELHAVDGQKDTQDENTVTTATAPTEESSTSASSPNSPTLDAKESTK